MPLGATVVRTALTTVVLTKGPRADTATVRNLIKYPTAKGRRKKTKNRPRGKILGRMPCVGKEATKGEFNTRQCFSQNAPAETGRGCKSKKTSHTHLAYWRHGFTVTARSQPLDAVGVQSVKIEEHKEDLLSLHVRQEDVHVWAACP